MLIVGLWRTTEIRRSGRDNRKTLDIRYPHHGSGLSRLVELLVEEGFDLGGLTVDEAQALARENGIEIGSKKHRRFGDHRGYEIPEDVLDLVFAEKGETGEES